MLKLIYELSQYSEYQRQLEEREKLRQQSQMDKIKEIENERSR